MKSYKKSLTGKKFCHRQKTKKISICKALL